MAAFGQPLGAEGPSPKIPIHEAYSACRQPSHLSLAAYLQILQVPWHNFSKPWSFHTCTVVTLFCDGLSQDATGPCTTTRCIGSCIITHSLQSYICALRESRHDTLGPLRTPPEECHEFTGELLGSRECAQRRRDSCCFVSRRLLGLFQPLLRAPFPQVGHETTIQLGSTTVSQIKTWQSNLCQP